MAVGTAAFVALDVVALDAVIAVGIAAFVALDVLALDAVIAVGIAAFVAPDVVALDAVIAVGITAFVAPDVVALDAVDATLGCFDGFNVCDGIASAIAGRFLPVCMELEFVQLVHIRIGVGVSTHSYESMLEE